MTSRFRLAKSEYKAIPTTESIPPLEAVDLLAASGCPPVDYLLRKVALPDCSDTIHGIPAINLPVSMFV